MKKVINGTILGFILSVIIVIPVLATVGYSAPYTITETNGTDYDILAVTEPVDTDWLVDNGFIDADALDTRIETIGGLERAWMVADDKIQTATPVPANSQTNLYFTTGNTDATSMDIIPGYGGYVTILDDAVLEFGNQFEGIIEGYFDTSAARVGDVLFYKPGAYIVWVSSAGNISAAILTDTTQTQAATTTQQALYTGIPEGMGNYIVNLPVCLIYEMKVTLRKIGNPTGDAYGQVFERTGGTLLGTLGTLDVSTVGVGWTQFTFNTTPVFNDTQRDVRIAFMNVHDDAGNHLEIQYDTNGHATLEWCRYDPGWSDQIAWVTTMEVSYIVYAAMVTVPCASGEHTISFSADTVNHDLDLDSGTATDSVALAGASVTDNGNNIVMLEDCVPHADRVEIYTAIGGYGLKADYEPVTMIIGTELVDKQGGDNDGIFTYGANPAGVSVAMGSMVSDFQPLPGSLPQEPAQDILPETDTSDWFIVPDVTGTLLTNPLRPFVTMMSDNSDLTELQSWRLLAFAIILLVTATTATSVGKHQGFTAMMAGVGIGTAVALTIYPMYALVFGIGMFIGGLVMERSPVL